METCYKFIASNTSDLVIIIADDFSIIFFNEAAALKLKKICQDTIGKNIFEIFAVSGLKIPIQSNYFNDSKQVVFKSDELLWKVTVLFLEEKKKIAVMMGQELQDSRQKSIAKNLAQIMDCTPGSLYWKDKDGRYLGCNTFMLKTAGLNSPEDIIGKTDFDLWPAYAKSIQENDKKVMQSAKTISLEEKVKINTGEVMNFASVKVPLKDERGKVIGVICNSLDITKLKKTEAELQAAKEKAEASDKAKSEFIHNMEHDIRTPFNGVWGFASILAEEETDREKKYFLSSIAACAKELLDYCDSILDFSKIEHGSTPIFEKSFALKALVKSVFEIENVAAKHKKLAFSVEYEDNLPNVVIGDASRLKRILLNLVGNAIKFTNEGKVKLCVLLENSKLAERLCVIKFIIEDTGIGIPEDKINVVYEKFTRGTPSNQGIYKGQGLGLRIVKQLVTELEGDIHLKSILDEGTTFTVLLPFKLPLTDEILDEDSSKDEVVRYG